jgi:hypothetical protein
LYRINLYRGGVKNPVIELIESSNPEKKADLIRSGFLVLTKIKPSTKLDCVNLFTDTDNLFTSAWSFDYKKSQTKNELEFWALTRNRLLYVTI